MIGQDTLSVVSNTICYETGNENDKTKNKEKSNWHRAKVELFPLGGAISNNSLVGLRQTLNLCSHVSKILSGRAICQGSV